MNHDFLAKRVVSDFAAAFRKNPRIDEFGFVYCPEKTVNKSPITVEGDKLGVETWCLKIVAPFIHRQLLSQRHGKDKSKLQEYSKVALLLNPECCTFWNIRKELFQKKYFTAQSELKFTNIILTCHPKSPETFVHKRWILRQAFSKNAAGISNHSDDTDIQIQAAITNELEGSRVAASGYPSNYNAWSHRIWTVKNLARSSTELLQSELQNTRSWVKQHVSDHSGFQYRQFLLTQFIDSVLLEEHVVKEFQFTDELLTNYPGHEALWNHRRALYHLAVQCSKSMGHESEESSEDNRIVQAKMARLEQSTVALEANAVGQDGNERTSHEGSRSMSTSELSDPLLEKDRVLGILKETSSSDSRIQERHCNRYVQWLERFKTL